MEATRHALKSDGAWVELRDVEDLRAKDRKKVEAVIMGAVSFDLETGGISADSSALERVMSGTSEAVAEVLICAWEIPYLPDAKLPRLDPEALGELRLADYDRVLELIQPAVDLLNPRSSRNPDDHADPQSPSEPASG
jgi:hypothetical protein